MRLDLGQGLPGAPVRSVPEGQMVRRVARRVEAIWVRIVALVAIARAVQHQQLRARGYGDTADQILRNAPVFLIIAWMLGGYAGATVLAVMPGGPRSPSLRTALARLGGPSGGHRPRSAPGTGEGWPPPGGRG